MHVTYVCTNVHYIDVIGVRRKQATLKCTTAKSVGGVRLFPFFFLFVIYARAEDIPGVILSYCCCNIVVRMAYVSWEYGSLEDSNSYVGYLILWDLFYCVFTYCVWKCVMEK